MSYCINFVHIILDLLRYLKDTWEVEKLCRAIRFMLNIACRYHLRVKWCSTEKIFLKKAKTNINSLITGSLSLKKRRRIKNINKILAVKFSKLEA